MKNKITGIFVCMQMGGGSPTLKWVDAKSKDYSIPNEVTLACDGDDGIGILQLHRVRCVNNTSLETEFLSGCSFGTGGKPRGKGTVIEGWYTKAPVEAGEWRWEVELKNGR